MRFISAAELIASARIGEDHRIFGPLMTNQLYIYLAINTISQSSSFFSYQIPLIVFPDLALLICGNGYYFFSSLWLEAFHLHRPKSTYPWRLLKHDRALVEP